MQRESHDEKPSTELPRNVTERKRRFRIVKLEERIAPGGGGHGNGGNVTHDTCRVSHCNCLT
jgi:hypothetical protein